MVLRSCALFMALVFVAGCGSAKQSSTDFDPTVDFSTYKKYAWAPRPSDFVATFVDQQIVKDIDVILGHRGFELVEENPDLVVRYQTGRKAVFADDGTTYGGTSGYTYDEGRLKIDFIDPRKQEIVYEGKSEVMLSTDERAKPEQVKAAILDALENFPPGVE